MYNLDEDENPGGLIHPPESPFKGGLTEDPPPKGD